MGEAYNPYNVADLHHFNADLDPDPHQSDENPRPLESGLQTLQGSILSLHTSIMGIHGPPRLLSFRILTWMRIRSSFFLKCVSGSSFSNNADPGGSGFATLFPLDTYFPVRNKQFWLMALNDKEYKFKNRTSLKSDSSDTYSKALYLKLTLWMSKAASCRVVRSQIHTPLLRLSHREAERSTHLAAVFFTYNRLFCGSVIIISEYWFWVSECWILHKNMLSRRYFLFHLKYFKLYTFFGSHEKKSKISVGLFSISISF